jgi:hypothetical protein
MLLILNVESDISKEVLRKLPVISSSVVALLVVFSENIVITPPQWLPSVPLGAYEVIIFKPFEILRISRSLMGWRLCSCMSIISILNSLIHLREL